MATSTWVADGTVSETQGPAMSVPDLLGDLSDILPAKPERFPQRKGWLWS
jgi:hypothetical protein